MTRILMVCLGNICRSPLAHGLLESKLPADRFTVDSAGTSNYHVGDAPDPRSITTGRKHKIDISNQRGQQLNAGHLEQFDLIYVMDNSNYRNTVKLAQDDEQRAKVHLILNEIFPGENLDVPDPYHGTGDQFERVYQMLDQATDVISARLLEK